MTTENFSRGEIAKFDALADSWWNPKGAFGALHDINPARMAYINRQTVIPGKTALDVGCGGGLLSEGLAGEGAVVTGIDPSPGALAVARAHMRSSGLDIAYHQCPAEDWVSKKKERYDIVTCMELLEHVPDPAALVHSCGKLVKPGGHVFFATLNRTFLSFLLAIVVAEHVLGIVSKGAHDWKNFIRPKDLIEWGESALLFPNDISGVIYLPVVRYCRVGGPPTINYLAHFIKPAWPDQ